VLKSHGGSGPASDPIRFERQVARAKTDKSSGSLATIHHQWRHETAQTNQ
jgi:hypothetical protein